MSVFRLYLLSARFSKVSVPCRGCLSSDEMETTRFTINSFSPLQGVSVFRHFKYYFLGIYSFSPLQGVSVFRRFLAINLVANRFSPLQGVSVFRHGTLELPDATRFQSPAGGVCLQTYWSSCPVLTILFQSPAGGVCLQTLGLQITFTGWVSVPCRGCLSSDTSVFNSRFSKNLQTQNSAPPQFLPDYRKNQGRF